ncbi:Ornithine carbamoyltransferase, catabolic [Sodalis praecaptivus]
MMNQLFQRNLLRLMDFTSTEINQLLTLAADLKRQKRAGGETPRLAGKNIALIFEKIRPVPAALSKLPPLIRVPA